MVNLKPNAEPKAGRSQSPPDAASASVDLQDIIDQYDGCSRRSVSSYASLLDLSSRLSKTYLTATSTSYKQYKSLDNDVDADADDIDETSFYSAQQDAFSLADHEDRALVGSGSYRQVGSSIQQEPLWAQYSNQNLNESDKMLPATHFQIYWSDVSYQIVPKFTLTSFFGELEHAIKASVAPLARLLSCGVSQRREYSINDTSLFRKQQPVTILQQISGSFQSGQLTAVIGPSGAGKTSLLNLLSRQRELGYTGQLYSCGANRRIKISTIPQDDNLPGFLSVRENLLFASRLKNSHPDYDDHKYVNKVSRSLGLDECLDTMTRKISGGQQKRLSIAQELLSRPEILILDEPTSGLDSSTCYKTLSVLKNLVNSSAKRLIEPIAILITIHQPEQEVFDLFDKIYVIASGGIVIYDGPPDTCVDFIERHSGLRLPDPDYNPASFLIEIASGEYGHEPIRALAAQVKSEFEQHTQHKLTSSKLDLANTLPTAATAGKQQPGIDDKRRQQGQKQPGGGQRPLEPPLVVSSSRSTPPTSPTVTGQNKLGKQASGESHLYIDQRIAKGASMVQGSFWMKTRILSHRCWLSIIRDPKQTVARIFFHVTFPILLAGMMGQETGRANACPKFSSEYQLKDVMKIINQSNEVTQEELMLTLENLGTLFMLIYALISASIGNTTLRFALDMQRSLKEFYNGWYTMPPYLVARFITDLPMELLLPTITVALGYPLTGQLTNLGATASYRVFLTALSIILGSMVAQTVGMIFGAIYIGHVTTALFASQGSTLPFVFLSGYITRTKEMSKFIYALSYTSFFRHTLEVVTVARYGYNVCRCDPALISGREPRLVGISDRLRSFTDYWMNTIAMAAEQNSPLDDATGTLAATANHSAYAAPQASLGLANSSSSGAGWTSIAAEAITNAPSGGLLQAGLVNATEASTNSNQLDLFQLFAKQISLYDTYGVNVKSCRDIQPHQLTDLGLSEESVVPALAALMLSVIVTKLVLFLTVELVIRRRTSL